MWGVGFVIGGQGRKRVASGSRARRSGSHLSAETAKRDNHRTEPRETSLESPDAPCAASRARLHYCPPYPAREGVPPLWAH
ncbi:hypothetical protein DIE18_17285 [Burkholderia sp. Bp9125]|nr:hypothetical protein DIE18_17285 [Burkholderia sp. Bp9125]